MVLLKIAWRNLWRNPLRSGIVMAAMAFGIVVMVFVSGFYNGLMGSYVKNSIKKQYGHIQIHHPEFREYKETKHNIDNIDEVKAFLTDKGLNHADRTIMLGLASVAGKNQAVQIVGIDTVLEKQISSPGDYKTDGVYLNGTRRNPVYLSTTLAEKLGLKLRKKIKLTYSDESGTTINMGGKITGLYDMKNKMLDMMTIYVRQADLNKNLLDHNYANEVLIRLDDVDYNSNEIDSTTKMIQDKYPHLAVENWRQVAPELDLLVNQVKTNQYVIRIIIIIALIFGIINTLLMSVLERSHEIGMMLAIGLNKGKTMLLIIIESLCLSLVAGPIGILLGKLVIAYYGVHGLDLSSMAKSLEQWGIDPIIKMQVHSDTYIGVFVLIAVTNLLASIYPAIKAIKLKPAEAIRK